MSICLKEMKKMINKVIKNLNKLFVILMAIVTIPFITDLCLLSYQSIVNVTDSAKSMWENQDNYSLLALSFETYSLEMKLAWWIGILVPLCISLKRLKKDKDSPVCLVLLSLAVINMSPIFRRISSFAERSDMYAYFPKLGCVVFIFACAVLVYNLICWICSCFNKKNSV